MSGIFGDLNVFLAVSAGALIAGLWQGMLLSLVAAFVLRLAPKGAPSVRFIVWIVVFCTSVAMPFVNLLAISSTNQVVEATTSHVVFDTRWSYLLIGLWSAAAAYRLVDLILQGIALRRLWTRAQPLTKDQLTDLQVPLLVDGRKVEICTSSEVDRPSVIGFSAPRILIPDWLFGQLTAVELDHIVLHELEHVRRRDDWVNLLQKIGLVLLPLNPVLFWIDARLATERELACDDGVLLRTRMPRVYASCLASIAEMRLKQSMRRRVVSLALGAIGAPGMLRGRPELSRRIESILRRPLALNPLFARAMAAAMVLGVLIVGMELIKAPQLIAFGPNMEAPHLPGQSASMHGARTREVGFHVTDAKTSEASMSPATERRGDLVMRTGMQTQRPKLQARSCSARKVETVQKGIESFKSETSLPRANASKVRIRPSPEQWMVLTSFDEDAPARVVVKLRDGQFFVVPYAAVPVRNGWLIVQL